MKIRRRDILLGGVAAAATTAVLQAQAKYSADLAIYGSTPFGIATAVAAARMGRSVLLCAHEDHIGGIVSNGLTNADIGKRQAVGGLFYEFTQRVLRNYQEQDRNDPKKTNVKLCRDGYWYEANLAERIFHEMISEQQGRIRLLLSHELREAIVRGGRLTSMLLEDRSDHRTVSVAAAVWPEYSAVAFSVLW